MLGARRSFSRLAAAVRTPVDVPRMPAFDHVPLPYDGPSAVEIARKRAEFLSPSLFHFYSKPVSVLSRSISLLKPSNKVRVRRIKFCCNSCQQINGPLQLNIVEGKKQYLYDEHGRRYLDAFAGIATVCCGHTHPEIIDAITAQANLLQHSTVLYLNHAIADFAEALAAKMPGDLKARTHARTQ